MAASVSTVEALIVKATDVLNKENDPNAMQRICQAITNEQGGVETAVRLIAHKIQSPQEWEALQALLILQSCVNNCGPEFHAEIGKYRFLNEMIKIISPKFLGLQRPAKVKEKVTQLLYSWTIDLPKEAKILDAYRMLKKQDIIQEDPPYLGMKSPVETKPKCSFKDEEKTRLLQKLLQSKNPLDISKANTLIKHMVKEDERRTEKTARRSIEVETAMTNVNVLDDMISMFEKNPTDTSDLDLMSELNSSCGTLQASIYTLVSEMDEEDEGIGKLLKANDELSRVIGRYKSVVINKKDSSNPLVKKPAKADGLVTTEKALLDLTPQATESPLQNASEGLADLDLLDSITSPVETKNKSSSTLDDILTLDMSSSSLSEKISPTFQDMRILVPDKPTEATAPKVTDKEVNPFEELDLLGSTLIRQNLPPNTSSSRNQFKPQEKLSLNEMIGQKQSMKDLLVSQPSQSSSSSDSSAITHSISLVSPDSSNTPISDANSISSPSKVEDFPSDAVESQKNSSSKAQFGSVQSMHNLHITLDEITPSSRTPLKLIDSNNISLSVHFTENQLREDVFALVVSLTSQNRAPVCNYVLQAVVPKGCKTRLLTPSSTQMAGYSPFLPPPAITQILLIANPNKLNVFLKIMLSYTMEDDLYTDMGEVENLPL